MGVMAGSVWSGAERCCYWYTWRRWVSVPSMGYWRTCEDALSRPPSTTRWRDLRELELTVEERDRYHNRRLISLSQKGQQVAELVQAIAQRLQAQ